MRVDFSYHKLLSYSNVQKKETKEDFLLIWSLTTKRLNQRSSFNKQINDIKVLRKILKFHTSLTHSTP